MGWLGKEEEREGEEGGNSHALANATKRARRKRRRNRAIVECVADSLVFGEIAAVTTEVELSSCRGRPSCLLWLTGDRQ